MLYSLRTCTFLVRTKRFYFVDFLNQICGDTDRYHTFIVRIMHGFAVLHDDIIDYRPYMVHTDYANKGVGHRMQQLPRSDVFKELDKDGCI